MKYLAVFFSFAILCSSCKRPVIPLLNTNNLPSSFITVDAGKDYQLKTFKGAVIKIAANSFDVPAGTAVSIEMKEAYSIQDILAAGLSTRSDGKLLQSGGMLYFNATANGKAVDFLKPVSITTPATSYNDSMQLFKGEVGKDSSVNWVKPAPLDTSPRQNTWATVKLCLKQIVLTATGQQPLLLARHSLVQGKGPQIHNGLTILPIM